MQENKSHYLIALLLGVVGLLIILIFVSMRSVAEEQAGIASATISNTAPTGAGLTITGAAYAAGAYSPTEGPSNAGTSDTDDTVTVKLSFTDANSCLEVADEGQIVIALARNGSEGPIPTTCDAQTETDFDDCIAMTADLGVYTDGDYTCTDNCSSDTQTNATVSCVGPFKHFMDVTNWRVYGSVTDGTGATTSATMTFTVSGLTAIAVLDTSLDFGAMALSATSSANAVTTRIRNTGNDVDMAIQAYAAANLDCSGSAVDINKNSLKISTSTNVGYESKLFTMGASAAGTGALVDDQDVVFGTETWTNFDVDSSAIRKLYFGLQIPATGVAGTCTTTVTVVGV